MKEIISNNIKKIINKEINEKDIEVEKIKDFKKGHFSSNFALKNWKKLEFKNPIQLAKLIQKELYFDGLSKVEIQNGFINIFLNQNYFNQIVNIILEQKEKFGESKINLNKKINLEYISANPTGQLHLGHARNGVIGSVMGELYKKTGANVYFEYYYNDFGAQIENLTKSVYQRYLELFNKPFEIPQDGYYGQDIIEIAKEIKKKYDDKFIDDFKKNYELIKNISLDFQMNQIANTLKNMKFDIDIYSKESKFFKDKNYKETFNKILEHSYQEDGATFLKTSLSKNFPDEKDRVIIKKDKSFTYLVGDILYHINKFERKENFDKLLLILGADHHGYLPRLKAIMDLMGYDANKIDEVIIQMVRLTQNNEVLKMSKRSGNSLTIDDLIKETSVDFIRYIFASKKGDDHLEFDIDLASKKDASNPVYYIQYAYVRINSLINKSNITPKENITSKINKMLYNYNDEEKNIIFFLDSFRETIIKAVMKKDVSILTRYIYKLASLFNKYYSNNKIIVDNSSELIAKIKLIESIKIVLSNGLDILKISKPEKM